jgi:hypothetical protein
VMIAFCIAASARSLRKYGILLTARCSMRTSEFVVWNSWTASSRRSRDEEACFRSTPCCFADQSLLLRKGVHAALGVPEALAYQCSGGDLCQRLRSNITYAVWQTLAGRAVVTLK